MSDTQSNTMDVMLQRAEEDDHARNEGADSPTEVELLDWGVKVPQVHHKGAHQR